MLLDIKASLKIMKGLVFIRNIKNFTDIRICIYEFKLFSLYDSIV